MVELDPLRQWPEAGTEGDNLTEVNILSEVNSLKQVENLTEVDNRKR